MLEKEINPDGCSVLLLGITFKENCNDIRNSKSAVLYNLLKFHKALIDVVDPHANPKEVQQEYGITISPGIPKEKKYDLIIVSVAHNEFKNIKWSDLKKEKSVLYDVKNIVAKEERDLSL